ncbi:MAG TPA: hypothetical protein VI365_28115 [Trebonia sp.]
MNSGVRIGFIGLAVLLLGGLILGVEMHAPADAAAIAPVAGENHQICNEQAQYLTSPWTYNALASGSRTYTVAQYEALSGYGTTLPPLPSYIANEDPSTTAAIVYAPGSAVNTPAYSLPDTPILSFFEGGSYSQLSLQSISGDQFIGGSASGFPEPAFNDGGTAGGISAQNDTFGFSGGSSVLASTAPSGAATLTTANAIPGFIEFATIGGRTYQIARHSGTTITLTSGLVGTQQAGTLVYANVQKPIAFLSAGAPQSATNVRLGNSSTPLVAWGQISIGAEKYTATAVSGSQRGYSLTLSGGLDVAATATTPVYDGILSGGVTVQYLDISDDLHSTTSTIFTGSGWTVENNDIHDSYGTPGQGVAISGGDESTFAYNCFSKMGDYAFNLSGTHDKVDYNEIYESNYEPDPGCGCSGGGKWWGTLNADIVGNAFINDGFGGGSAVWLDNGNSGTLISGNYFSMTYGSAVVSETGFNVDITGNLFVNGGWGAGSGACGSNCDGAVYLNSSGGFNVPGSRYEDQVSVTDNQFINNWMGVDIWQTGSRTCENSGEGGPGNSADAAYCSGGFPNTDTTAADGQYYFSHIGDSDHYGSTVLAQDAAAGSSTILVQGPEAIDDQIGFTDPPAASTSDTTNTASFTGSGTINANTSGFPSSGQLRVGTSAAWADGGSSATGAILSYTGITGGSFTGVSLVRGTGTLSGPILGVQPYKVTAETCFANDCAVNVTPAIANSVAAGDTVTNAGTCQLYATSTALPSGPIAPDGVSYWDGCQWEARDISVDGNTFVVDPSVISSSTALTGATPQCTAANFCGTNFMAWQEAGEAPFDPQIAANAMMSSSSFTGCPYWDSGCGSDPLANLNALSSPPNAPPNNGEAPYNDVWANNSYSGPWSWSAYLYGNCGPLPSDGTTGDSLPASSCQTDFTSWQRDWQQDVSSSSDPTATSPVTTPTPTHTSPLSTTPPSTTPTTSAPASSASTTPSATSTTPSAPSSTANSGAGASPTSSSSGQGPGSGGTGTPAPGSSGTGTPGGGSTPSAPASPTPQPTSQPAPTSSTPAPSTTSTPGSNSSPAASTPTPTATATQPGNGGQVGSLSVKVTGRNGHHVAHAAVTLDGHRTRFTNANGLANFTGVPSGRHAIRITAADEKTLTAMVSLHPGASQLLNYQLPPWRKRTEPAQVHKRLHRQLRRQLVRLAARGGTKPHEATRHRREV